MKRVFRGLRLMQEVFGLQFTAVIVGVLALLLWAVYHQHGPLAFVASLICVLLAIRAHDVGDLPKEEPSELDTYWGSQQWTPAEQEQLRAQKAQHDFNQIKNRDAVALGKPHDPVEL
jgi:hypothetical protein